MKQIKVGDRVKIITGDDVNKTGEVIKIFKKTKKVLIKGINLKFKHQKPRSKREIGSIKQIEAPVDYSNVKLEIN